MIMKHVDAEEYVIAVINLYLDIINLFIKIVKILDAIKRSNEQRDKKRDK
jgi:protein lifeguard